MGTHGMDMYSLDKPRPIISPTIPKSLRVVLLSAYALYVPIILAHEKWLKRSRKNQGRVSEQVSLTAQNVCFLRALLTQCGLLDDQHAQFFVPFKFGMFMPLSKPFWWISRVPLIDPKKTGAGTLMRGRTLMGENVIREVSKSKTLKNLVLLGAGFDSKFQRLSIPKHIKLYEVDIKPTQDSKKKALVTAARSGLPVNPDVQFVSVDFNTENFLDRLKDNGFNADEHTLFLWEGVTYYLEPEAVTSTLETIANNLQKVDIYLDVARPINEETLKNPAVKYITDQLTKIGEPFKFGLEQSQLGGFFRKFGMEIVQNLDPIDIENTYARMDNGESIENSNPIISFLHVVKSA